MKKTLIALMALSGVAMADITAENAVGMLYRDANGDFVTTDGLTLDGTTLTFSDTSFTVNTTSHGRRTQYTMGVLIDMSKVGTLSTNQKIVTTAQGTAMGLGLTTDTELASVWGNNVPYTKDGTSYKTASIAEEGLVTLVHSTGDIGGVYLVEGSDDVLKIDGLRAGLTSGTLNSFSLNGSLKDAIVAVAWWTDATTESGALTDLATINTKLRSTLTPEPATATLSLLALAGLAARRRRH